MKKRQVVVKSNGSSSNITHNSSSGDSTNSSPVSIRTVRYGECQKNHAANIGGYAVDGCREFMASAEEGIVGALACAACGCHVNFHRREVETDQVVVSECSSTSHSPYYQ